MIGLALTQSCTSESKKPSVISKKEVQKEVVVTIDSIDTVVIEVEYFTSENFQKYADSILDYFDFNNRRESKPAKWTCDTSRTDRYMNYNLKVFREGWTNPQMHFEIFEFENKEFASDYFNDLKTQEYLLPVGLNKRPNHILVDSNRVFWHHMEHPYGHRMDDLNAIFAETFNFYPKSSNLDSVSGFTYCRCHDKFVELNSLQGDWVFDEPIQIKEDSVYQSMNRRRCHFQLEKGLELSVSKDSLIINENFHHHEVHTSMKLPDNKYYWKYQYFGGYQFRNNDLEFDLNQEGYTEEFTKKADALMNVSSPVKLYTIDVKVMCYLKIVTIEGHGTYCESDNKLSRIRRK